MITAVAEGMEAEFVAQFKPTYTAILKYIREMSINARLLLGAMLVILVMSLVFVADYAGTPDLVPLAVDLDQESRGRVVSFLESRQIRYRDQGGALMVPVEQRYVVLGELQNGDMISSDQIDFDQLIQQDSPFMSRWQNQKRWQVAKMNVVSRVISNMQGIRRATVVIDVPERMPGIGTLAILPSASVSVETDGTPLSQDKVDAIARNVARAQAGMKIEHVAITDLSSGRHYRARGDESVLASTYLEVQQNNEKKYLEKLQNALAYIPGVNVAVNVIADARAVRSQRTGYENPKIGVLEEESRTLSSTNTRGGPRQPGVEPNTGLDVSASAGATSSMSDERAASRTVPAFPKNSQEIVDGKGYALKINASIGIPKSYFVGLWRDQSDAGEDEMPDAAALDTIVQAETSRIEEQVRPLVDTGEIEGAVAGAVYVSMYNDVAVASAFGGNALGNWSHGGAPGAGPADVGGGLVKYVGLGGLAFISLAMMFMMVRKASFREQLPTAEEIVGVPPALTDEDSELVGEADESDTPMEGIEIDEESQRRQQMLQQINEAAREQPEETATILRKWIRDDA